MSEFRIDQITNQSGSRGPDIAGITTFTGTSGMVMPSGPTEYRGGRGRGVWAGGYTPTHVNTMDYVTIASTGNASDFGDLTQIRVNLSSCSSSTRGIFASGVTPVAPNRTNTIDYITIASLGDAIDFGDLTSAKGFYGTSACSSQTHGLWAGGPSPYTNAIDFVTITSTGDATDFGDLTQARQALAACSDAHGGLGD